MADSSAPAADATTPSAANEFVTRVPNMTAREKFPVKLKGTKKEIAYMQRTLANIPFIEIAGIEVVPDGWYNDHWRLILGGIGGLGCIALCFYGGYKFGIRCQRIIVSGKELFEIFQKGKGTLIKWLESNSGKKVIETFEKRGNLTEGAIEELIEEVFKEALDKAVDAVDNLVRGPALQLLDMAVEVWIRRLMLGLPPFSEVF